MTNETERELNALAANFQNKDMDRTVTETKLVNPFDELRFSLMSFIKNRLEEISSQASLLEAVEGAILQKIANNEITVPQLIGLYKTIRRETTISADGVFALLSPNKEGENPLLAGDVTKADQLSDTIYNDLTDEDQIRVDTLARLISSLANMAPEDKKE